MTRVEAIFGGVLLLAVIAAASFALFSKGGLPGFGAGNSSIVAGKKSPYTPVALNPGAEAGVELAVFTGDRKQDVCTCYENGFAYGNQKLSVQSVEYKSGYSSCRTAAGPDGGHAWTEGWDKGQAGKLAQRSCKIYLKRIQLQ
jgi:hypothetical protein